MSIIPGTKYVGKISSFGGPADLGLSPSEGLALYNKYEENPSLFLDYQPAGTTGLARRLNPEKLFCAMRWDYTITPKAVLRKALVKIVFKDMIVFAEPCDFGPALWTNRIIDVSPGAMKALGCQTDDEVECVLIL